MNVPLNLSSGSGGRKQFNIAPEFANSPYLTKPIGIHYEKQRRSGSPTTETPKATSTTRKDKQQGDTRSLAEVSSKRDSDVESLASLKSHHTARSQRTQQSFRSVVNTTRRSAGGGVANKSFLLPREMDKLLREFRQKNSNHSILAQAMVQTNHHDDDDSSTIASDFAECLDDKGVYIHARKDPSLVDLLFSGPLFAELAFRNATKDRSGGSIGPMLILPPLDSRADKNRSASGDLSDLDSLQSGTKSRRRR
jgi:hypothetical protein